MTINITTFKKNPRTCHLAERYESLEAQMEELRGLAEKDRALAELAAPDLAAILKEQEDLLAQMKNITASPVETEEFPNEIVLEIRAGAGGEEAALFAKTLAQMYHGYADRARWSFKAVDESKTDLGGYKEAVFEIRGADVYKKLRFETGVHRIQRVPATEKSGRIHTSTASVAILPIRKSAKLEINPADLIVEFSRAGGKGGQNVNKVETAVRIVHKPSGIDVRSTAERSQSANRERAMAILRAKLELLKAEEDAAKLSSERKNQIGTADRSEKIRTYNVLQDRVTDHRIKESWHAIDRIFEGGIEEILAALGDRADVKDKAGLGTKTVS